jgi:hypothetical protein
MNPVPRTRSAGRFRRLTLATGLALTTLAGPVGADPTLGFVEYWPGTSTEFWSSQAINTNPGTGGLFGAGDGYLRVSTVGAATTHLGSASFAPEYDGDWQAAGVTRVRLWLNDVGADDPLEIHFAIGNGFNFWQYNPAFLPPHGQWAEFVVDLTNAAAWTRIIGFGTFDAALQTVNRILVRHDNAPFMQTPDGLVGDFGIDRLLLTNASGIVGVPDARPAVAQALRLEAPTPNPSRGAVTFALQVPDGSPVRIEIVDAGGRLVRRAELAAGAPGARSWVWDGRDDAGRVTPAGYYQVRAVGRAGGMSRGLVRVR